MSVPKFEQIEVYLHIIGHNIVSIPERSFNFDFLFLSSVGFYKGYDTYKRLHKQKFRELSGVEPDPSAVGARG